MGGMCFKSNINNSEEYLRKVIFQDLKLRQMDYIDLDRLMQKYRKQEIFYFIDNEDFQNNEEKKFIYHRPNKEVKFIVKFISKEDYEKLVEILYVTDEALESHKVNLYGFHEQLRKYILNNILNSIENNNDNYYIIQLFLFSLTNSESNKIKLKNFFDLIKNIRINPKNIGMKKSNFDSSILYPDQIKLTHFSEVYLYYLFGNLILYTKYCYLFMKEQPYTHPEFTWVKREFEDNLNKIFTPTNIRKYFFKIMEEFMQKIYKEYNSGIVKSVNDYLMDFEDFLFIFEKRSYLFDLEGLRQDFFEFYKNGMILNE